MLVLQMFTDAKVLSSGWYSFILSPKLIRAALFLFELQIPRANTDVFIFRAENNNNPGTKHIIESAIKSECFSAIVI